MYYYFLIYSLIYYYFYVSVTQLLAWFLVTTNSPQYIALDCIILHKGMHCPLLANNHIYEIEICSMLTCIRWQIASTTNKLAGAIHDRTRGNSISSFQFYNSYPIFTTQKFSKNVWDCGGMHLHCSHSLAVVS